MPTQGRPITAVSPSASAAQSASWAQPNTSTRDVPRRPAAAVVTSSRNSRAVLDAAGLTARFPVVVDGNTALTEQLRGKPAPDMYLFAARVLGVAPELSVVLEDALSGVAAAAAGGLGHIIGVDRGSGRQALADAGATVVVADCGELA